MKGEFITYLESIGITKALRKRIETIQEFYRGMCTDEITGIFVTDYIRGDGAREYENLWFFSEKYLMEAKQFISQDDFDIAPIQSRISYWTIQKNDYDFEQAAEKSRLYLKFNIDIGIVAAFKASKENCDHLKNIMLKYIRPNLKE